MLPNRKDRWGVKLFYKWSVKVSDLIYFIAVKYNLYAVIFEFNRCGY